MTFPIRALGNRVALINCPDAAREVNGVYLPESPHRGYISMEVAAKGNGIVNGAQVEMCEVAIGDRVFVQVNPMQLLHNVQKIGDQTFTLVHEHDVLATLTQDLYELTVDDFQPVGTWLLARIEVPEKVGEIFVTANAAQPMKSAGEIKLFLVKQGKLAQEKYGIELGSRILIDTSRANPLSLDVTDLEVAANTLGVRRTRRERFVYVDACNVNAVYTP